MPTQDFTFNDTGRRNFTVANYNNVKEVLPEHILQNYPILVSLLEAYYEFEGTKKFTAGFDKHFFGDVIYVNNIKSEIYISYKNHGFNENDYITIPEKDIVGTLDLHGLSHLDLIGSHTITHVDVDGFAFKSPVQLTDSGFGNINFSFRIYSESAEYEGSPSRLIHEILKARDIDDMDENLLINIEDELLLGTQYFRGFTDKRTSAKFSNNLYRSKGTLYSIQQFFKMFFDEYVDVEYTKKYVFTVGNEHDNKLETEEHILWSSHKNLIRNAYEDLVTRFENIADDVVIPLDNPYYSKWERFLLLETNYSRKTDNYIRQIGNILNDNQPLTAKSIRDNAALYNELMYNPFEEVNAKNEYLGYKELSERYNLIEDPLFIIPTTVGINENFYSTQEKRIITNYLISNEVLTLQVVNDNIQLYEDNYNLKIEQNKYVKNNIFYSYKNPNFADFDYRLKSHIIIPASDIGVGSQKVLTNDRLYQTLAILIKTSIPLNVWKEVYKLFVHPAGMYLGARVLIENDADLGFDDMPRFIPDETLPQIKSVSELPIKGIADLTYIIPDDDPAFKIRTAIPGDIKSFADITLEQLDATYDNLKEFVQATSATMDNDSDGTPESRQITMDQDWITLDTMDEVYYPYLEPPA